MENVEKEFINFYNKKINDIYKSFEKEYLKKNLKDQDLIKKEKILLKEIDWIKNISKKIDSENNLLIVKYENMIEDNFSNKTTNNNLKNELKKIKLKIIEKREDLRILVEKDKNYFEKNKSLNDNVKKILKTKNENIFRQIYLLKKNKKISSAIKSNLKQLENSNKKINKFIENEKNDVNSINPFISKNKDLISNLNVDFFKKNKPKKIFNSIKHNLEIHINQEKKNQTSILINMKKFDFFEKKLSVIFLKILENYFKKQNMNFENNFKLIDFLSNMKFLETNADQILEEIFNQGEIKYYQDLYCNEKNKNIKEQKLF